MIKDIHFQFNVFYGTKGQCHIRLAKYSHDKPLVIVCSQYNNYYGMSVTNAFEIIVEKLFNDIANDKILGVSFDFPIPVYREWHNDVNSFDRILALLFPDKYNHRFRTTKLNITKIFSNIFWIERHPPTISAITRYGKYKSWENKEEWKNYRDYEEYVNIITLDDEGGPYWHNKISESVIIEKTGFHFKDLLSHAGLKTPSFSWML